MTCLCTSSTSDHIAGQETLDVMDEDLEHLCNVLKTNMEALHGIKSWIVQPKPCITKLGVGTQL